VAFWLGVDLGRGLVGNERSRAPPSGATHNLLLLHLILSVGQTYIHISAAMHLTRDSNLCDF
jgi:hypothetical protein